MVIKKCKLCNKIFRVKNYRKNTAFYCSRSCAKLGRKRSDKIRKNI